MERDNKKKLDYKKRIVKMRRKIQNPNQIAGSPQKSKKNEESNRRTKTKHTHTYW